MCCTKLALLQANLLAPEGVWLGLTRPMTKKITPSTWEHRSLRPFADSPIRPSAPATLWSSPAGAATRAAVKAAFLDACENGEQMPTGQLPSVTGYWVNTASYNTLFVESTSPTLHWCHLQPPLWACTPWRASV